MIAQPGTSRDRDVAAFDRRAEGYERGPLGNWHAEVAARVAELAGSVAGPPRTVLDLGCGTGLLLDRLTVLLPAQTQLVGVDPAAGMLAVAVRGRGAGIRPRLVRAAAERLPFPAAGFDLVVTALSFDHWADQQAGLRECARVLRPGGTLLLADLLAGWLAVTGAGARRERARTPRRLARLLLAAGLRPRRWVPVYGLGPVPLVQAVLAERPRPAVRPG